MEILGLKCIADGYVHVVPTAIAELLHSLCQRKRRGQASRRASYPVPPLPKVHQKRPGSEKALPIQPMFDTPLMWLQEAEGGPHHRRRFEARQVGCNPSRVGRADPANIHLDEREDAEATRAAVEKEGARCVVINAT